MTKEIKVLHLISSTGFFGAERVVIELAEASRIIAVNSIIGVFRNQHNIHIEVEHEARERGIETQIFGCKGRFDLRTIRSLRGFIRLNGIDIVHTHGYKANIYGYLATLSMNVKRITTCHNWLSKNLKMNLYEILDKLFLRTFSMVVVVSEALKQEVLNYGIPQNKIAVINNGINVNRFQNAHNSLGLRKTFGISEDEKIIGTVSRLTAEKGHVHLLKAAKNIITEFPHVKFLIIGDGPLKKELEGISSMLQLEGKVIFAGLRKEIPDILGFMNIFVLPSLTEGTPMALLEAMAAGKPLIASRVGAIPKIIEHGRNGVLVEPGNSESLCSAITDLLRNPQKANTIALAGLKTINNKFSSQRMAEDYRQVYQKMLS